MLSKGTNEQQSEGLSRLAGQLPNIYSRVLER